MSKRNSKTEKREYLQPIITVIGLDNDISLQLQSNPPNPDNEDVITKSNYYNQNPFVSQNG